MSKYYAEGLSMPTTGEMAQKYFSDPALPTASDAAKRAAEAKARLLRERMRGVIDEINTAVNTGRTSVEVDPLPTECAEALRNKGYTVKHQRDGVVISWGEAE